MARKSDTVQETFLKACNKNNLVKVNACIQLDVDINRQVVNREFVKMEDEPHFCSSGNPSIQCQEATLSVRFVLQLMRASSDKRKRFSAEDSDHGQLRSLETINLRNSYACRNLTQNVTS